MLMNQASPYTPGEIARVVPGRTQQITEFHERLSVLVDLRRLIGRVHIDHAPRGIGKTSLLRQYQRIAAERGVLTLWVTAGEAQGLINQIGDELRRASTSWSTSARESLAKHIDQATVSVGVPGVVAADVTFGSASRTNSPAGSRAFEDLVRAAAAQKPATGVIFFIDELQSADPEGLRTLLYAWQHLQAEGETVPAAVFAAGLPNTPDVITSVITFSERVAFSPLESLQPAAEEIALRGPASTVGVTWTNDAITAAHDVAVGYPYAVQLIAHASWNAAGRPDVGGVITADHVAVGRSAMRADMDSLFRSRWANASSSEKKFMVAMAVVIDLQKPPDEAVSRGDIAEYLSVSGGSLSVPRGRLIDKGLIQAAGYGRLGFTIPGFAEFILELEG